MTVALFLTAIFATHPAHAQLSNPPQWQTSSWARGNATLDLDFVNDRYYINGTTYPSSGNCTSLTTPCLTTFINGAGATFSRSGTTNVTDTLPPFYTDSTQGQSWVSRAAVTNNVTYSGLTPLYALSTQGQTFVSRADGGNAIATYFDNTGTLQTAAAGTARSSTYTYSGGSWVANTGTLIEPAVTNQIRNNTMSGAVASTSITAQTISSITNSTTTATVTTTATHGLAVNNIVTVTGASPAAYNGTFYVTSVNAANKTFTYTMASNPGGSATTVGSYTAQTQGTLPTNWSMAFYDTGVPFNVVGTGVSNGITYIDLNFAGVSATGNSFQLYVETLAQPAITVGQTAVFSLYLAGTSGANPPSVVRVDAKALNSSLQLLNSDTSIDWAFTVGNSLSANRITAATQMQDPTTSGAVKRLLIFTTVGNTYNFTLRIGMPQLEVVTGVASGSSGATSVIATSGSAVTRAADVYNQEPASYFNSTGVLNFTQANTARSSTYTYSGSSWVANSGTLIEPAATNSLRNNMMVGAAAADGIERTTSGTFSSCSGSTCTGWTTTVNGGTGSVSFGSNTATLTGDGSNAASIYQAITTVSGYIYTIAVTTGSGNAVTVEAGTSATGANAYANLAATSQAASTTISYQFKATGSTSYVQIYNASSSAATVTTVSVQSAGAFPTNWSGGGQYGIIEKIVGTGTDSSNINYIDVSFTGTATLTNALTIFMDSTISATSSQTWAESIYLKTTSGSFANVMTLGWYQYASGPSYLASQQISTPSVTTTWTRYSAIAAPSNTSTAYIQPYIFAYFTSGSTVNVTLRIGIPQLEQSSYVTSVMPTFGSAVTRTADVFNVPNGGTYFNSLGVMKVAGANVPRLDYGSNSGGNKPLGVLIEESRTNSDVNSTFSGAVAGSPGSVSGWSLDSISGVTVSITGSGTEFGMPYLEVNFSGTNSTGSTIFPGFNPSTTTSTSASATWAASSYVRLVSGTLPYYIQQYIFEYNSSQSFLSGTETPILAASLSATTPQSIVTTDTVGSSTAYVEHVFKVPVGGNASVNVTIRFYSPQMELGAFPTSFIPTYGSAITRSADTFTVPVTGWLNQTTGASPQGTGTLLCNGIQAYAYVSGSPPRLCDIDDGVGTNLFQIVMETPTVYPQIQYNGSAYYSPTGTNAAGALTKTALAYTSGSNNSAVNGVLSYGSDNTSSNIPTTLTTLAIGSLSYTPRPLNGWVNRITYLPDREPDASLQDYTR